MISLTPLRPTLTNQPKPRFGWNLSVDVGTSSGPNGKTLLYDDTWIPVGPPGESQHLLPTPAQIKENPQAERNDLIIQNLAHVMAASFNPGSDRLHGSFPKSSTVSNLSAHGDTQGKTLVFFMPGQILNNVVDGIDNGKTPILNLDINQVAPRLQQELMQAGQGLSLATQPQVLVLNDVAGGSAAAVAKLAEKHPDKFKPGLDAVYMMSGGGVGVSKIFYTDNGHEVPTVRLQMTEEAAMPIPRKSVGGQYGMGQVAGNMPTLLEDFAKALPPRYDSPQRKAVALTRNGRIATDYESARQFLPDLTPSEFHTAAGYASREYITGLACNAREAIHTGSNMAILGGKTTSGVRDYVNANPHLFLPEIRQYQQTLDQPGVPRNSFDKVFLTTVWNQLNGPGQTLFREQNFDVVSDLNIGSNNEGAPYIAQGWPENRQDRYAIPVSAFLQRPPSPFRY